ncbi:uncharacterized protein, partial [Setaria viridis]|uniref:uncharacterized protein n=1 Tax=Setaria viridis TaxID=4556 RepID=UPI003B3B7E55
CGNHAALASTVGRGRSRLPRSRRWRSEGVYELLPGPPQLAGRGHYCCTPTPRRARQRHTRPRALVIRARQPARRPPITTLAGLAAGISVPGVIAGSVCAYSYLSSLKRGCRRLRVRTLGGVTTQDNCAICQDSMDALEVVLTLSCNHVFHCGETDSARTTPTSGFAVRTDPSPRAPKAPPPASPAPHPRPPSCVVEFRSYCAFSSPRPSLTVTSVVGHGVGGWRVSSRGHGVVDCACCCARRGAAPPGLDRSSRHGSLSVHECIHGRPPSPRSSVRMVECGAWLTGGVVAARARRWARGPAGGLGDGHRWRRSTFVQKATSTESRSNYYTKPPKSDSRDPFIYTKLPK